MKTHYLHISYQGLTNDDRVLLGEALIKTCDSSLAQIKEHLKNDGKLKGFPTITSLSEISEELYEMLSTNTEDNEQH